MYGKKKNKIKKTFRFLATSFLVVVILFSDFASIALNFIEQKQLAENLKIKDALALAQGDGKIIYGEGAINTPRTRDWTGTFSAEGDTIVAAASTRHVIVKASPVRDEMIVGIQTTGGVLYVQRWNGTTWSNEWNVTVGSNSLPRFDISFESTSGDMMVVYSGNTATDGQELKYRIWNGSAWTVATNLGSTRTTGVVDAVALERRSGTDEIALVYGDSNFDLSANFWDGATNAWKGEPAAALEVSLAKVGTATTLTNFSFDLEFESISGELLIVWGADAVLDGKYVTRGAGPTGAWGTVTTNTAFLEEPTDIELSADPNSDYIAYANSSDNGADSDAIVWTGTAWGTAFQVDASNDTVGAGTSNNAVNWVTSGAQTRAVLTYDDANAAGIDWAVYNKNTNAWAIQTDCTTACSSKPASGDDSMHRLRRNPFNEAELLFFGIDSGSDLVVKKLVFDGTNLTWSDADGGTPLELTISSLIGFAADFAYNRYIPVITTTLGTGTDPGATTIAPGASATDVDLFTLQTDVLTETVTSVTVNLSTASGISLLSITDNANTVLGSTASPVTGSNTITVSGLTAGTTLGTFKVRVTPLSHALQPAVPGATYSITAPVTAWAGNATTHTGTDTNLNALTIDNFSPSGATSASGTAGNAQVTLNWTTSASSDFSRSVVLRRAGASAGAAVPAEGTDYIANDAVSQKTDYSTGSTPRGVAFDSSTNSIWVVNNTANTVTKLNASTGALVGTYNTGAGPRYVAFDSSTNSVWITNYNDDSVTKLTASTGALVGTYNTGSGPRGLAFDPSTNSIWIANNFGNNLTKLTAATGALVGTYATGANPIDVAFDSSTNSIWATNYTADTASKLSAATGALVGTYATGATPFAVAFDSSTNSIWVANDSANTVTKLNAGTGALVGTYAVGTSPLGIAFDSSTNSIWATNNTANTVTKITAATGALLGTYATGANPFGVAFDSLTNSMWVANNTANTVSKMDDLTTVACVRTSDTGSTAVSGVDGAGTGGCSATALTNGQAYTYKVFQKDSNGNYDAGVLIGTFTPVAVSAVTTLADGTNPVNVSLAPGGVVTDLDAFTLTTNTGTDTVTAITVTLSPAGAFNNIGQVDLTDSSNVARCSAVTNPASNTISFTTCSSNGGIPVSTTATTYKVRITPKTHANMPAVPGATYATTGTVTAFTSTNAQAGTDAGSATVTIDNLSPSGATLTSGSAGDAKVTLNWTTSAAPSAPVFVQDDTNVDDSGATSATIAKTFTSNVTTGNLIVVFTGWGSTSVLPTISDNQGNTYTAIHDFYDTTNNQGQRAFYAKNVTGGSVTVTATWGTPPPYRRLYIAELSGADATTPLDGNNISLFTGSTGVDANTSGTFVTTAPNNTIVGFTQDIAGTGGISAGTSFTAREQITGIVGMGETRSLSSTGTYAATFTDATTNRMITSGVAFKASSDFSRSVVLRWTGSSAGAEVPAEGTDYANGNTISTATVVCVRTTDGSSVAVTDINGAGGTSCLTTALTNGQAYTYKVFQKDTSGNYDAGVLIGTFTPAGTSVPTGTLTSGVFDTTGGTDGAGYNSIFWTGTIGTGAVRFQLATADVATGPWNYYGGATCGSADWFDPGAPDTVVELKGASCQTAWGNKRYYRYKVQICWTADCTGTTGTSPIINGIIVNWAR